MKKIMVLLATGTVCVLFAFIAPKNRTVGHWKVTFGNGAKGMADFRADGTFESSFENYDFKVGGEYKIKGDFIYISDTSCGKNYWGKYKQTFFTNDSALSTMIEDSCVGRRASADGAILVRMK